MVNLALIGIGYWGNNLLRNLLRVPDANVSVLCDIRPEALNGLEEKVPGAVLVEDAAQAMRHPGLQAVVIATPADSHFELAMQALQQGLHVLVEKPMTMRLEQAEQLQAEAVRVGKTLMIDQTCIYTPAMEHLRAMLETGERQFRTLSSVRMGPYAFRREVNILEDVGVHDLAILDYLTGGKMPERITATGAAWLPDWPIAEAVLNLDYGEECFATVHVSWLCPEKNQYIRVNFSDGLAICEEQKAENKLRIYDWQADESRSRPEQYRYQLGTPITPDVPGGETLLNVCSHYIHCIETGSVPRSDGAMGVRLARILEASHRSLASRSAVAP